MYLLCSIYEHNIKNIYYTILGSVQPFPIPTDCNLIGIAVNFFEFIRILFSSINLASEGTIGCEWRS